MTVIISNRGPYQFKKSNNGFIAQGGAGGIASSLGPLLTSGAAGDSATWIAAALTPDDRAATQAGQVKAPGIELDLLDLDEHEYLLAYNLISNSTLWFIYHGIFDLARRPRFDHRFREAWAAYENINQAFANAAAEKANPGDVVLIQDYQLNLVPAMLRSARPDLRIAHFSHTPFCGPNSIRILPPDIARAICGSMASVPSGFHSARWARSYEASAREMLGSNANITDSFVAALGPDHDLLAATAQLPETAIGRADLKEQIGDRAMILRVDRIDPSKNILRGFSAYQRLLETHPEWRDRVVFVARLNASRQTLPEYIGYRNEVEQAISQLNDEWGTNDWSPIILDERDDFPTTAAAFADYDVLLVNPIKDGLNLVAKEGPLLNQRDGVLCLSPEAGAWDELGADALSVHPYDIEQVADSLNQALTMEPKERAKRAASLRNRAGARQPIDWLKDQLAAAK